MNNNWVQDTEDRFQKLIQIRQKLFSDTFLNIELKKMNLSDQEAIIQKERKRLNLKDKRITLDQLQLGAIKNGDNLYNLVKQKKVKIIDVKASQFEMKIKVETHQPIKMSIQSGTLMLPLNDIKNSTQTLIVRDQLKAQLKPGVNNLTLKTFCYNEQLKAPQGQKYLLGSIRCLQFSSQLNQTQVWEITIKKKQEIMHLESELKRKDYIALTKKQVDEFMNMWND